MSIGERLRAFVRGRTGPSAVDRTGVSARGRADTSAQGRAGAFPGRSAGTSASAWPPARRRLGAAAAATALLTGAAAAALGGTVWHVSYAVVYVALAAAAVSAPGAIAFQVMAGQVLGASLLLQPDGPAPLLLVPLMAAVVLTAELLGLVARLDAPVERDVGPHLPRAYLAALMGGGVYAVVLLAGAYGGVTGGLVGVSMGAGACVLLAVLFVRSAR